MNRPPRTQDALHISPRQPQPQRGPLDPRSANLSNGQPLRPGGRPTEGSDNNQSRAARFEDEKQRIVESCFSKRDPDGVQTESYITHVRVIEDAVYATLPPPPESDPSNKKSRVILVAVRRSGRVKVHKARENPTGSFSIGKTWNLDELSSVQSYTNLIPRSNQEQLEKEWAGGTGFIVTLGKPYYWQVPTAKEKDFFIASLVKIYRKYTGGKLPELYGFATQEVEALTGLPPTQKPAAPAIPVQSSLPPQSTPTPPPSIPAASERRPQSPYTSQKQNTSIYQEPTPRLRSQSRSDVDTPLRDSQRQAPSLAPEPIRSPARTEPRQQIPVENSGQRYRDISGSSQPSTTLEHAPPVPPFMATSRMSPSPQSSQTSLVSNERQKITIANGVPSRPRPPFADSARGTPSVQSVNSRPSTAVSEQKSFDERTMVGAFPSDEPPPPERRRPLMANQDSRPELKSGATSDAESQFATPAVSPSDLKEELPQIATISNNEAAQHTNTTKEQDYFGQVTKDKEPASVVVPEIVTPTVPTPTVPPIPAEAAPQQDEGHRPGLGPMIKKKSAKDIAGQFRKAALAAQAFQPRQGGGAARLRALQEKPKTSAEPDGITGVVPAPLFRGLSDTTVSSPGTPTQATTPDILPSPMPVDPSTVTQNQQDVVQEAHVTKDTPSQQLIPQQSKQEVQLPAQQEAPREPRAPTPEKARSRSPQRRKRQRQEAEVEKYCSSLGIDPRILDGKGGEYNDLLSEFGWNGKLTGYHRIEEFEIEIKREIGRAQATGWLGHVEQQEGKVQDLAKAFDKAIEECEELDGLFTLYSHELETLAADIEYIEAQSQGLQVQTANQKLLQTELQNLLRTLTIPPNELRGLRAGSLESIGDIERIESCLALLYKALITIDPNIRQNRIRQAEGTTPERSGIGVYADAEIGQMRAVREKKDDYREETMSFVRRFNQHMTSVFKRIDQRGSEENTRTTTSSMTLSDSVNNQSPRQELWTYNALMLFVREVNSYEWQTLVTSYEMNIKSTYQDQFRDYVMSKRKLAHKPNGEELEALFTTQDRDKTDETLASTAARKLTVRRGKTVKVGALKQTFGKDREGKHDAWEVFNEVLEQQSRVISEEQNFIVHFFHLNSQTNADFAEIVASSQPAQRKVPNLSAKQSYDPDRNMAKIVQGVVEGIYSFWLQDMQSLVEWTLNIDQLQGVGVLSALEQNLSTYEETNQEYITRTVRALHDRLTGLFHKFVDEQIKAVEETKVKIKKRKGIISFMRTFPIFVASVEHMIPTDKPAHEPLEVRFIVNDAYSKILKAMWESLNFIAKDDPTTSAGAVHAMAPNTGDPEDKEALNHHILLIENMSHYIEEVETHHNIVLEDWADRAKKDMSMHLSQYTDAVIRRPLGKWLDFLESTEAMIKSSEGQNGIANRPSHSRSAAKKVLSTHDAKEIRKGIDTLKKRIEKHFADVDDPTSSSKKLILKAFDDCGHRYAQAHDRMKSIVDEIYDGSLEIDWRKEEAVTMFKQR